MRALNQLQESDKKSKSRTQNRTRGFKGIQRQFHNQFMNGHSNLISTSFLFQTWFGYHNDFDFELILEFNRELSKA